MESKFFLHRIRKDGEAYNSGIEVHDTLDSAIQSFHAQMKMAYGNPSYPNMKYVSCAITDGSGELVPGYSETWNKERTTNFFVHYIRHDGDNYTKGIEVHSDYGAACRSYHTHLEYGYGNTKFPNITFVGCRITNGNGITMKHEAWNKIGG